MTPKPIMAMRPEGRLTLERLTQPSVKPFHHPIRLRMIRPDQPMFDPVRPADAVQAMRPAGLPRGLPFFVHRKPIRKGPIIIQDGVDCGNAAKNSSTAWVTVAAVRPTFTQTYRVARSMATNT